MTENTTIRAWYVSKQRISEILDLKKVPEFVRQALTSIKSGLNGGIIASEIGHYFVKFIHAKKIPSFQQLAISNSLKQGDYFIYQGHLFGKGFGEDNKTSQVNLHEKVHHFLPNKEILIEFSKSGITTDTGLSRLSGSVNLFAFCSVIEINDTQIRCVPYIIGDLIEKIDDGFSYPFQHGLKLKLGDIDQLKDVDFSQNVTPEKFLKLGNVSEKEVKSLFGKLLSEADIQKDWGGEESDIFTSNLSVNNDRYTAAFLLKGKAKFHEMFPSDCGKNGDQIYRLFNTPADVYILQHCHKISPAVRKTMEAFALAQYTRPCRFAIIDGYDTYRILKKHGMID